jgi:hypothetical protein
MCARRHRTRRRHHRGAWRQSLEPAAARLQLRTGGGGGYIRRYAQQIDMQSTPDFIDNKL